MKVKEILTEIGRLKISAAEYDYDMYASLGVKWKPLPGGSGLLWAVDHQDSKLCVLIAQKITPSASKEIRSRNLQTWYDMGIDVLGQLETSEVLKYPFLKKAYQVDNIFVKKSARNRGIGKSLYGVFLSILKYTLVSGTEQTASGRRSWLNFSQIPGVEVKGIVAVDDAMLGPTTLKDMTILASTSVQKADQIIDSLMELGGQHLGSYHHLHYFGFDVVPGTGELRAAVNNQLSKIYSDLGRSGPVLFAKWVN